MARCHRMFGRWLWRRCADPSHGQQALGAAMGWMHRAGALRCLLAGGSAGLQRTSVCAGHFLGCVVQRLHARFSLGHLSGYRPKACWSDGSLDEHSRHRWCRGGRLANGHAPRAGSGPCRLAASDVGGRAAGSRADSSGTRRIQPQLSELCRSLCGGRDLLARDRCQ